MPSSTFLNLPKDKKDRIIAAAKKEMAATSYESLSINKIIKEANIPRGSFYAYFDDKEDLCSYIISGIMKCMIRNYKQAVVDEKGDLFKSAIKYYEYFTEKTASKLDISTKKHIVMFSNNLKTVGMADTMNKHKNLWSEAMDDIYGVINKRIDKLNEEEKRTLFETVVAVLLQALSKVMSNPDVDEKKKFTDKINLLEKLTK